MTHPKYLAYPASPGRGNCLADGGEDLLEERLRRAAYARYPSSVGKAYVDRSIAGTPTSPRACSVLLASAAPSRWGLAGSDPGLTPSSVSAPTLARGTRPDLHAPGPRASAGPRSPGTTHATRSHARTSTGPTRPTGSTSSSRKAHALHHPGRIEGPLRVGLLLVVHTDRGRRAGAPDTRDARLGRGARHVRNAGLRCAGHGSRRGRAARRRRHQASERRELRASDRVHVLLPQVALCDEEVDVRRVRVRFAVVHRQRPRILLAAIDQFQLAFALDALPPGRQRDAHPDGRYGHRDEQHDHNEPAFVQSGARFAASIGAAVR
jgi:hypothetical protein